MYVQSEGHLPRPSRRIWKTGCKTWLFKLQGEALDSVADKLMMLPWLPPSSAGSDTFPAVPAAAPGFPASYRAWQNNTS